MFLYPDGLSGANRWFIGQKQDFVMVYFILMVSSLILWSKGWFHKPIIAIGVICAVSLLKILTLGLTFVLCIIVMLVLYSKKTMKYISAKKLFLIYLAMELIMVSVVFYLKNYLSVINILSSVSASDQLSKKDTFLERVSMWRAALDSIVKNPFGLLASLLFLYLNYYVYNLLNNIRTMERNILVYSLFGINVLMLTESLYFPFVFCIYMLSFAYVYNYRNQFIKIKL